jgi:hypothetical protein
MLKVKHAAMFLILVVACSMPLSDASAAGTYLGKIQKLDISIGTSGTGASVHVSGVSFPACRNGNWFAFEHADTGKGKLLYSALLLTRASGKDIYVVGNAVCDPWNIEGINWIEIFP